MKIVIDIDEELYNYIHSKLYDEYLDRRFDYKIRFAVKDGTLLPDGHGDLKDVNDLYNHVNGGDYYGGGFSKEYVYCDDIANAPTIIEADKEV